MLNIYCDHPISDIFMFSEVLVSMQACILPRAWTCYRLSVTDVSTLTSAVIFQKILLGVLRGKCFQYISISIFENWVLQHRYWMTESLNLYPLMAADDDDEVKGHYKMITEKQKLSHKRHKILQIFFRL